MAARDLLPRLLAVLGTPDEDGDEVWECVSVTVSESESDSEDEFEPVSVADEAVKMPRPGGMGGGGINLREEEGDAMILFHC